MPARPSADKAREVYAIWKQEDRKLEQMLDKIREWMRGASESVSPPFAEAASRLLDLHTYLVIHFEHENVLSEQLFEFYERTSPEIEGIRRQAVRDHRQLLEQLNLLITKLNTVEQPFATWTEAIDQVEWFVDALEQHEDLESESICAMIPCAE